VTDLRELRRLEPWFYRAPSAHNTQPWVLEYAPEKIELRFEPERHLRVGDPTRRDLYLSLGCFAEAVLVTATANGIPLEFDPRDLAFVAAAEPYRTDFGVEELERRQTSRLPYEGGVTEEELAPALAQLGPEQRLHVLSTSDLLPLFVTADRHVYESPALVEELRSWLRLSKRHPRYERDGLTYECLALTRFEALGFAFLLHPRVYPLAHALRLHRRFTASAQSVLEHDGTVLVLEAPGGGESDVLEAGRTLFRLWLALTAAGFATHPLSQILDCEATERELAQRLGVGPGRRLLNVFRAGRSAPAPRSHRLVGD
jgi:nitroreductase